MFSIDHVNGQGNNSRIKDFSFQIEKPVIHALLCPSISFLDELMNILLHDELITSGRILINNLDYFSQMNDREVQFITGDDLLHSNLSILENVFFSDRSLVILNKKRNAERFKKLLEDTGFVLNDKENIENLSGEQRKVIEILKCYYSMPKLVIVREVSNLLTFKNFALFLSVLEKMKQNPNREFSHASTANHLPRHHLSWVPRAGMTCFLRLITPGRKNESTPFRSSGSRLKAWASSRRRRPE